MPYLRPLLALLCGALSGAAWGLHETTVHHYATFQARFPGADPQWWNPALSWLNKYVGHNVAGGRNHIPIWFTDAAHLTASVTQVAGAGGGIVIGYGKKKWWQYAVDFGAFSAGYIIGNQLFYK